MPKNILRFISILVLLTLLPACGGRAAHPVPIIQSQDERKSCQAISTEMDQNENTIEKLQQERSSLLKGNILKVVFSGLTFGITLFFLDLKGAPQVELNAMQKRNDHLYNNIYSKRCPQQPNPKPINSQQ